jgi:CMP-N,N'-diacetyllegionaminic acid synthase
MLKCLALIPARGGSKGVPRKNVALVGGKPLLAWTIESALKADCIERVIVSTDDEQIAQVARDLDAEVPFLRPAELARDDTPGIDPLLHAVEWLAAHENYLPEWVILLQPTSPLRTSNDIEEAFALARDRHAEAVVSITSAPVHPFWIKKIDTMGRLSDFVASDKSETRRQDLPPAYAPNGAIYLIRRESLLAARNFFGSQTYAYVMPEERSLDLDTPWDLHLADLILRDKTGDE